MVPVLFNFSLDVLFSRFESVKQQRVEAVFVVVCAMAAREASAESAAESVESTTLEALPDDAMLAVLSYLSPAQLLEARTVCRRWRRLALHPHLWRQRRLVDSFHGTVHARLEIP